MKKLLFLCILSMAFCTTLFAQRSMEWYSYWGSNIAGSQIQPVKMAMDNQGNLFVGALFGGENVSVGGHTLVSNSSADKGDAVVIKVTPSNTVEWVYPIVNQGKATIADLKVNASGNVFVTGNFNRSIRVGDSIMVLDDTNDAVGGAYVLKLKNDGTALRAWQIAADNVSVTSLALDHEKNVIIAGTLDGEAIFTNGTIEGDFTNTAQLFVAKYNYKGQHLWHQLQQSTAVFTNAFVDVDKDNNIYLAGGLSGSLTLGSVTLTSNTGLNAGYIVRMNPAGTAQWGHIVKGEQSDDVVGAAVSASAGQVAFALNHTSDFLCIDNLVDSLTNGYYNKNAEPTNPHAAVFCFDLQGQYQWWYDFGYGSIREDDSHKGSQSEAHILRSTKEGVWYLGGMTTERYGDLYNYTYFARARNSGVVTVDDQWIQHNTNGGEDAFLVTLTREGQLSNVIRPGGIQYELAYDVAMSPDQKSMYLLMDINVRDKEPSTCPDNLFDSYSDITKNSRQSRYTILPVYCPEAGAATYTTAYKNNFNSLMLVKYRMPEINPNSLPYFTLNQAYNQTVAVANPQGAAKIVPMISSTDVTFNGTAISGTFADDAARYVGALAVDSIALPGTITYYEYDNTTHRSLRSNPRALRYMPLLNQAEAVDPDDDDDDPSITPVIEIAGSNMQVQKVVRDGCVYILRNNRIYDAFGHEVR